MYNAPRAATCRVATDAVLWVLDRISFKVIVVAAAMQKRETYKTFLSQVPILESLTEMEILTLADSLAEEKYEDGVTICTQGEEGNYFYIIKEGAAVCSQTDASGNDKVVANLSGGNYFGEIALLFSKPRQATVRAKGQLKVLAIDRATFTRVFGSMENIMKRNMEQYIKYAQQNI
jgi:cAMP-dependent protein kinase regulator